MADGVSFVPVSRRALDWIVGGDCGISSRCIWAHMVEAGSKIDRADDYPGDPSDFGRCYRLLNLIPEWRERIGEMAEYGRVWAGLAAAWSELESLYDEESQGQRYFSAPRLYARMKEIERSGVHAMGSPPMLAFCAADGCETWATRGEFCSKHYKERKPKKAKKPRRPLLSEKPIKRSNPKRRKSEFARCYHSRERVRFVKSLPCIICGQGPCDNAHIENGGAGRKADYTKIVPLCCMPSSADNSPGYSRGHHGEMHNLGVKTFLSQYRNPPDLEKAAAETEAKWQAWLRVSGTPE